AGRHPDDVVREPREGIEPEHGRRVGDEVRRRVDVVEVHAAVLAADQVFDPADVDRRLSRESPRLVDDGGRRLVARNLQPGLRLDRAGAEIGARRAGRNLTDVGGAQVEVGRRAYDSNRVQVLIVQHLDPHDRIVPRLDELLDQRRAIRAEVERARARLEIRARVEALDERARAADVRLDQQREPQLRAGLEDLVAVVHDDGPRIADAQALEEADL